MTHGNGASCPESLQMYEDAVLGKLQPQVKFTRDTAFVPSFMEDWIFYQVTFANGHWWTISKQHKLLILLQLWHKQTKSFPVKMHFILFSNIFHKSCSQRNPKA